MKSIFFTVLILFSARAFAGYSFVQETAVQDNNVSPFTTYAFSSATTTGNAIVCTIMYGGPATSVQSITDGGDTFQGVGSVLAMTGNNSGYSLEVWYALSITGRASPSISFFFNGGTPGLVSAECAEYSGVTALDQHTSVMRTAVTTANIGPVTTVANNELSYIGATCNTANSFTYAGTGFAKRSADSNDVMMEDSLATTAGPNSGSVVPNSSADCGLIMATFQTACITPSGVAGMIQYMPSLKNLLYCDGNSWHDTSHTTGGVCSTAGQFQYAAGTYQYCNGSNWIGMQGSTLTSCSGNPAGTLIFDSTASKYKFCDGTNWYDTTATTCRFYLTTTGAASWSVPSDWNNNANSIEVIGGGGGGSTNGATNGAAGGGGGGYSVARNQTLTPSSSINYFIGTGGVVSTAGGDTYFCNSTSNCASVAGTAVVSGVHGGGGANITTAGTAGSVVKGSGFAGGGGHANSTAKGGGGGGAGGSTGAGITAFGTSGGAGDNGNGGAGGASGNAGNAGTEWSPSYGSGGGGGGGISGGNGGNGGNYGSGGGGAGKSGSAGKGNRGVIVITYSGSTCS